jgi:5-methylcytosine-specific restriction endonuclease McrA
MFDRFGYTCRYCGRSVWSTLQDPVALDHLNPKYLDENRDDFDVENSMLACR